MGRCGSWFNFYGREDSVASERKGIAIDLLIAFSLAWIPLMIQWLWALASLSSPLAADPRYWAIFAAILPSSSPNFLISSTVL
jgi:hypothetical protein